MKCGFCGNELENGAQFCPNCGMIISLGEENETAQENDTVVESVYNVFKSNIEKEKKETPVAQAKELAVDPTEEKVEFVMSLPEFGEYVAEPIKAPEHIEIPDHSVEEAIETEAETAEEVSEETEAVEEIAEIPEIAEETELETEETAEEAEDIYSYSSEETKEQDMAEEAEVPLDIRVPEVNVIYEGPEKAPEPIAVAKTAPKNEELRKKKQAKENLDKISPDKKENKKSPKAAKSDKKGIDGIKIESVLGIAVAVVLVLFACVYAVKNDNDYTYSLLKLREQEHDAEDGSPADGDTPGVTISFISFESERLLDCLSDPSDENRRKLNAEVNRVVAYSHGEYVDYDINEALQMQKTIDPFEYSVARILSL